MPLLPGASGINLPLRASSLPIDSCLIAPERPIGMEDLPEQGCAISGTIARDANVPRGLAWAWNELPWGRLPKQRVCIGCPSKGDKAKWKYTLIWIMSSFDTN